MDLETSQCQKSYERASDCRCVVDTLDLAVDRRITAVGCPLWRSRGVSFRSSPELRFDSPIYRDVVVQVAASTVKKFPDFRVTAEMDAHLGTSQCQQSYECASDCRCVVDTLDLAVDRRITAVGCPLRRSRGVSFRSSPELRFDSSPMYRDVVVQVAASTVTDFNVTAEMNASDLKSMRPPHVRSSIAALDLAGDRRISLAVRPPMRRDNFRSCPELRSQLPVYGGGVNTVPPAPVEILQKPEWSECRKSQYASEGRCVVDVDRRITAIGFPLKRRYGDSFRSSPELRIDSPVYRGVVVQVNASTVKEFPDFRGTAVRSLIAELDLAGDRRLSLAVGPPLRRDNFRSCPELIIQLPVYNGGVNTVPPAPAAEILQQPAQSERRKSAWKRSRRFIWKGLVNAARRICFCRSFVDME
ncbi:unnamed protein product [Macrosiphum euphorbiae]|uniref:Uncharacterized protein n=1 Tax=Macrosiphum euphorbiae TaxID=13131 RepID=A0AAV0X6Z0_9HEMI|nr:unnamed protein product [Macrosiphum euphorbiae]